jgi:hypothetical protein
MRDVAAREHVGRRRLVRVAGDLDQATIGFDAVLRRQKREIRRLADRKEDRVGRNVLDDRFVGLG